MRSGLPRAGLSKSTRLPTGCAIAALVRHSQIHRARDIICLPRRVLDGRLLGCRYHGRFASPIRSRSDAKLALFLCLSLQRLSAASRHGLRDFERSPSAIVVYLYRLDAPVAEMANGSDRPWCAISALEY